MSYANKNSQNIFLSETFEKKFSELGSEKYENKFFESDVKVQGVDTYENNITKNREETQHSPANEVCIEPEDKNHYDEKQTSSEILTEPITKLKNLRIDNRTQNKSRKKNKEYKTQPQNFIVSLRYGKCGRKTKLKRFFSDSVKNNEKIISDRKKSYLEKKTEVPKKGKRGRLGGKAKGKPSDEESLNNYESDEDAENFYFYRISLGHFQKLKDDSGASTSNQHPEIFGASPSKYLNEKLNVTNSDEIETELLELERWGRSFTPIPELNADIKKLNQVNLNQDLSDFDSRDVENQI